MPRCRLVGSARWRWTSRSPRTSRTCSSASARSSRRTCCPPRPRSPTRRHPDELGRRRAPARQGARARHLHPAPARGVGRARASACSAWRSINQECGVSGLASLGLNAMAPDEGNMHTLLIAGHAGAAGDVPAPAGRGPHALVLRDDRARRRVVATRRTSRRPPSATATSGSSTGASGASPAPRARRSRSSSRKTGTDEAAGHRNYSLILVPTDTPGWEIERHPEWMGSHSPGGHPIDHARRRARARSDNLLGNEGEGFVIAQQRLAGGRLAHAMRWIGVVPARAGPDRAAAARAQGVRQGARPPPGAAVHDRRLARWTSTRRG